MRRRVKKKRLLIRDGKMCGLHLGGCGKQITHSEMRVATVDHIIPKGYFLKVTAKDEAFMGKAKEFEQDWNCQLMHGKCNQKRGGQIIGYPRFNCGCHFLHITGGDLYIWVWEPSLAQWASHKIVREVAVDTSPIQRAAARRGHEFVIREHIVIAGNWRGPGGEREIGYGKGESGHIIPRLTLAEAKKLNFKELVRSYMIASSPEMQKMGRNILEQLADIAKG